MAELAGVLVGNYFLLECLAHEGSVETYRARPIHQGGYDVVLRLFRPSFPDLSSFRAYFSAEVEKVWRCSHDHEHIQPLLEFGTGDDLLYTATLFAEMETLEQLLEHQGGQFFPSSQAVRYVLQLCDAVQCAHEQEIVHGNIQPSSILIRDGENVLLTNFGIRRAYQEGEPIVSHMNEGNAAYSAPEQALGMVCSASDIYGLGVLLYRLLAGVLPYSGETAEEIVLKHTDEPIPSLRTLRSDVSEAVEAIVTVALAKNPTARFPSAAAFAEALQAAVLSERSLIVSSTMPQRRIVVKPHRTSFTWSRALTWLATVVLLFGLLGTSFFVFSLPQLGGYPFWVGEKWFGGRVAHPSSTSVPPPSTSPVPVTPPATLPTLTSTPTPLSGQSGSTPYMAPSPTSGTGFTAITPTPTPTSTPPVTPFSCGNAPLTMDVSSTVAPLLQQVNANYALHCPGSIGSFTMSDSRTALNALQAHQINVALSDLTARSNRSLTDHPFAVVLYALVVSPDISINGLSQAEIQQIYQGQITNWSQVGGPNEPIIVVLHPSTDTVAALFQQFVLNGKPEHVRGLKLQSGWAPAVALLRGAITYVPLAAAQGLDVSVLALNGVLPGSAAVQQNTYPFWGVEHLYTQGADSPQIQAYLSFLQTRPEMAIMSQSGMFPVRSISAQVLATHLPGPQI